MFLTLGVAKVDGVQALRVTEEAELTTPFAWARRIRTGPYLIEFVIDREANVLPMVPPGEALDDMILE